MTLADRIKFLEESHRYLNNEIDRIEHSKVFDDQELSEKKKKRLQLKDELAKLHKQQFEEQHERVDLDDY